jgi:hypothetical protein
MVTISERKMAKTGRPRSGRDDASVKIERGLLMKAKLLAAHKKLTVAELLSAMLRPSIEKSFFDMTKEIGGK